MIDSRIVKNLVKEATSGNKIETEIAMLHDTLNLLYKAITVCENYELADYYYANASTLWGSIDKHFKKLAKETRNEDGK